KTEHLNVIKSEYNQILKSRSYTREQVRIIASYQTAKHSLSTQIAYSSGLRAHELFTLEKASIQPADERPAHKEKFLGREGELYTVTGKGGLTREILIPYHLAEKLEQTRLAEPKLIEDRGVFYKQNYNIAGGKNFSNSFSTVSKNRLNWSGGAHGLRHSYAQERMKELQMTLTRDLALEIVSQELGHFRPQITEVYLR
ncbi:site-specific integrase, partial [Gilliamella sp. Nev3-1]|uniref:site-specific integrase n=2 Tax=Gilliamella sp. Nev3-1 TaxID=3120250 RepID=UPI00080E454F